MFGFFLCTEKSWKIQMHQLCVFCWSEIKYLSYLAYGMKYVALLFFRSAESIIIHRFTSTLINAISPLIASISLSTSCPQISAEEPLTSWLRFAYQRTPKCVLWWKEAVENWVKFPFRCWLDAFFAGFSCLLIPFITSPSTRPQNLQ